MILAYVSGRSLESFMCESGSGGILLIGTRKNSCAFWEREPGADDEKRSWRAHQVWRFDELLSL